MSIWRKMRRAGRNAIGMTIYNIGKDIFNDKEGELVKGYLNEIKELDAALSAEYSEYVSIVSRSYSKFSELMMNAFSPDVETAFGGSIALAAMLGVPSDEILTSHKKIVSYFTE